MVSAPVPLRNRFAFFQRAEGAVVWTDVPIYLTSVQEKTHPLLSAFICGENCS
jgi:hypothetical protein